MKITKEAVPVRHMWESRIALSGLTSDMWNEGQVVRISEVADFANFLSEVRTHIFSSMNEAMSGNFRDTVPEKVFGAIAESWAHQRVELPISVGIAVLPDGSYRLTDVAADNVASMVNYSTAFRAWKDFHYEGDPAVFCINYVENAVQAAAVQADTVKILCREGSRFQNKAAEAISRMLSGKSLVSTPESKIDDGAIYVSTWVEAFAELEDGSSLLEKFFDPNAKVLQPAWVSALDNNVVAVDKLAEADYNFRAWINITHDTEYPILLVAEEDGKIIPVVLGPAPVQ